MWFRDKYGVAIGVEAADIMDHAIIAVQNLYSERWGRSASYEEIVAIARFCLGDESNGVTRMRVSDEME